MGMTNSDKDVGMQYRGFLYSEKYLIWQKIIASNSTI